VPEIEGVAVIAQGGGNSEIKKEIVEAVQVLFDIKAHKIKVMKMNS
jgi:stage III sporulation protein AG